MSNGWGGRRTGAGRPINPLKSQRLAAELIERNKRLKGDDNAPTPLEYWLAVLWNPAEPAERRDEAARVCMPYIHPKLQSVSVQNEDDNRVTIIVRDFTKTESGSEVVAIEHQSVVPVIIDNLIHEPDEL
jgi:hypothetical protein